MKALIDRFLNPALGLVDEPTPEMALDLATAVLLVEVSRADFEQDASEAAAIRHLLLEFLSLTEAAVDELLRQAHQEADQLVSLQHVTRWMNEALDQQAKLHVIELMWRVVYADGHKHHYEEHLLRQVAELLYVPHADFIRARHNAEDML